MPTTNAGWDAFFNPAPAKTQARMSDLLGRYRLTLTEEQIGGVHCYRITPRQTSAAPKRLLMHLHGGAHVGGAEECGLLEALLVAGATGVETVSVDYRMPPAHPFPAPLDDATSVWNQLIQRYPAHRLGGFGTSSGGGMALALPLTQRANATRCRIIDILRTRGLKGVSPNVRLFSGDRGHGTLGLRS